MRVWVTRASPGAERTADALRKLGHSPLLSPVMRVRQLPAALDLTAVAALAFTSANGVEAFAVRSPGRDLKVFAVGDATAQAAREAGFSDVVSAHGDVEALGRLLASAELPQGAVVLHPGGRELAGDLPAAAGPGVSIRRVALYETVARAPSEALSVMDTGGIDAVLVHSSKAARRVAAVCAPWREGRAWYFALSPAVAAPLIEAGFEKVRAAPFPDEAALLKLLSERPTDAMTDAPHISPGDGSIEEPEPYAPPDPPARRLGRRPPVWGLGLLAAAAVFAAVGVAVYAPRSFNKPKPAAAAPVSTSSEVRLQARIAELESELARSRTVTASGAGATSTGDLSAIEARLDRLEVAQGKAARAASAAVAAAALADAASTSRPFTTELITLQRLSPNAEDLAGLKPLAETGAPTASALASEFPEVADRAAAASREGHADTSLLTRVGDALSALFTLRRVGNLTGDGPDAVLARAERRVADGDIEGALEQLKALPVGGQRAVADWRERAERRVEIERRIAALRAQALRDLAQAESGATSGAAP